MFTYMYLMMPLKYMQCKPIINFYFFFCYNPNYRAIFVQKLLTNISLFNNFNNRIMYCKTEYTV